MNSRTRTATRLSKCLLLVLFLTVAPAALASSTWYVDGVNGNDSNDCLSSQTACQTIGHAIALCSPGDTIRVAPAIYKENLTINISLKIIGSDATATIVDGNHVDGTTFTISERVHVRLSKLTIRNGYGRGIYNRGTLTVNNSVLSGNDASYNGAISNGHRLTINNSTISGNSGAGIMQGYKATAMLTINNSTISGNVDGSGVGGSGGINLFFGTLTMNNSTISGNTGVYSGAISIDSRAVAVRVNNSTISGNSSYYGIGGFDGTATLRNSIVANDGANCNSTMTSNGYNLSSDDTCHFNGQGDVNNTDPKLKPLGNYGGPTQTMALRSHSPAIDAGNPSGCTDSKGHLLKTDQRGWPRPGKHDTGACDIGAFERQKD